MPRTLILMRHAKQSGLAASDHERPLTLEGRDAAHRVGERLRREGRVPDRVLCSTALRCRETWAAIEGTLAADVATDVERRLYNASARDLLEAITEVDDAVEALLVLAHNPGISMLGLELASGSEEALDTMRAGFTPATTAAFEIEGPWSGVSARSARLLGFAPDP